MIRLRWITEGVEIEQRRIKQLMRWIVAYWSQITTPRTDNYEVEVPDQEDYIEFTDWDDELTRRKNSIKMFNENFADMGARMLQWPTVMNGPDRFPDQIDPEMLGMTGIPADQFQMVQSIWLWNLQ